MRDQLGLLTRPVEEERAAGGGLDRAAARRLRRARAAGAGAASTPWWRRCTAGWRARRAGCSPSPWPTWSATTGPVNQPGTNDEYPNWRVPLAGPDGLPVSLEDIREADLAPALFAALRGRPTD